jgi:hypothetical protein
MQGDAAGAPKAVADAIHTLGLWTQANPSQAASTAAVGAAAGAAPAQPVPMPLAGVAVEIAAQAHAGNHRFQIRLDPPELGRIDVRLDVDRDGHVTSRLVVDRADTLDLLKRDAAQLERALQQAGLKMSDNALEFALRQHAFAHDDADTPDAARLIATDDTMPAPESMRGGYGLRIGLGGGLDIRV